MNPTLWKVLLGTTLGAAATDEAEAAWVGPNALQKVGDAGYDALASLRRMVGKQAATANPAELPQLNRAQFNKNLWNQGSYGTSPKQYMFDDAGNLRKWTTDHWTDDQLVNMTRESLADTSRYGPRNQFRLDELMGENSLIGRAMPELRRNTTIRFVDDLPEGIGGSAAYNKETGGGVMSLNKKLYSNLDDPSTVRGLLNVTEHELQHMIDSYQGLQGGASDQWFMKNIPANTQRSPLQNSPDILYLDALGERLARSAGGARGDKVDPFKALERHTRPSWIPEQSTNAQGEKPWSNSFYGEAYPHKSVTSTTGNVANALATVGKGVVSDPSTYVGLIPKLGGLGPALGMWASDLGNGEQLPEGELAKQLGLIGAITGGGF